MKKSIEGVFTKNQRFSVNTVLIYPSDHAEGVTPVPIPNTVVKPLKADGTTRATARESR